MSEENHTEYEPPELVSYGTIEELTEGFGDGPTDAESGSAA